MLFYLGPSYSGAAHIAKTLPHLKCRHSKGFLHPSECILHLLGAKVDEKLEKEQKNSENKEEKKSSTSGKKLNPDYLMVGANDIKIRSKVRELKGVPM